MGAAVSDERQIRVDAASPFDMTEEVIRRMVVQLAAQGRELGDFEVKPEKAPTEPSVVDRLAAVDDETAAERVRSQDEAVEQHEKDVENGIVRVGVNVRVQKPANYVVLSLKVDDATPQR